MRIDNTGNYRCISLIDEFGKVDNEILLIIQKAGFGKSLASESIIEELHNFGYVTISLTDVKDEFESCYAMFRPTEKYHLDALKKCGKMPLQKKVRIYHPFTFNIPKTLIPKINFFTIPISSLDREIVSFIAESEKETDSVRLVMDSISDLTKNNNIYDLIHNISKTSKSQKKNYFGKQIAVSKKDSFYLDVGQKGTSTNISEVVSWFKPFVRDYFLAPQNFRINLDVKGIIDDKESYHCLSTKWIKDEKMKYFTIICFINEIFRYKDQIKYPICFLIEEVAKLAPFRAEGCKAFLASCFRGKLLLMRSQGKGFFAVMTSQVWSDLDEKLREKSTQTLIGNIQGIMDIDRISKVFKLRKDDVDTLNSLKRNQYILQGDKNFQPFDIFLPSHCHAEAKYSFIEMYSRNGYTMKKYDALVSEVRQHLDSIEKKYKEKVEKDKKNKIAEAKEDYERSIAKDRAVRELEELKQKVKNKTEISREEIIRKCKQMKKEYPELSIREIADRIGISKSSVSKYLAVPDIIPGG